MVTKCVHCPIRRKPLFRKMSTQDVDAMQRFKVGELVVDPGTPILLQGSNSPQLYTVLHGYGVRSRLLENGRRQVINFVLPGDFLGLQAGLMGEMGHSVEATTKLTLCVFDRAELWGFVKANPEQGFELAWLAAVEEHFLGEALTTLGQRTARQSIAWALVRLFKRAAACGLTNDASLPFPFRQQDLADALGLSLVHTNKLITAFRNEQLISWADNVVQIYDLDALAEIGLTDTEAAKVRPIM